MNANPLLGGTQKAEPASDDKDKRVVKLVSNVPPADISGLEEFLAVFNSKEARAEITQFRYVIQRRVKRALGGKFSKGLTTEVTENTEVKLNEDLFGLKRWLGAIRQDPSSLMLMNIHKIKEDAVAAPLVFSEMLKTGRPILITGAEHSAKAQLLATIDPQFSKIPKEVENDAQLKTSLLARVQRRKGFLQSMRNLLEFDYLPDKIRTRINEINTGGDPSKLSEAEIINLCLLSDTASRYRTVLEQFKTAMETSSVQVPQLMAMFELLTADFQVNQAVEIFKEFLDPENTDFSQVTTKSQLFGHIFRFLSTDEGSSRTGRMDRMSRFFKSLTNNFVKHRSRIDPFLWKHCHFLGKSDPGEKKIVEGLKPLFHSLQKTVRSGEKTVPDENKKQLALHVFELIQLGNQNPADFKSESEFVRLATANRMLSLIHQENGHALDMSKYMEEQGKVISDPVKFLQTFLGLSLTLEDLRTAIGKMRPMLFLNEMVAAEVQKSTLDVIGIEAEKRGKTLRDIYILNALSELVTFPFFLGEKKISNIDRVCAINVSQNRLGLEVSSQVSQNSIGLFTSDSEPPVGKLQNDPALLQLAYTELMGLQVEKLVKKAVDHKINYLQTTYGTNFFEVIYNGVVTNNNLPLSRNQFAAFIMKRRILGNLDAKGWKPANENELSDPFLLFMENPKDIHNKKIDTKVLEDFDKKLVQHSAQFRQLLNDVKTGAEEDPGETNPKAILWSLFKQGIYNLSRNEAKNVFRKSVFFKILQELIAKISSEHYSVFTKGIVESGIKILIPWKFSYLQLIGNRFGFMVGSQVVKYQLLSSPTDKPDELDEVSRLLYDQLETIMNAPDKPSNVQAICEMGELIDKTNTIWRDYSRSLSLAVLDRVLSETVIKKLVPGRILPHHLWYLPDPRKLCLGKGVVSSEAIQFAKVLQVPENIGNIVKNPRSSSTTIDDFSIQVHKIDRLQEELRNVCGISEDVLDILQNISHEKAEGPATQKYEQALQHIVRILSKPLRHITEKDIQALHSVAKQIKDLLYTFYNSPSPQKQKVTSRLQNHLQARRSDGHSLKLNFTDDFIIDKTEIKVMQKVKKGEEVVSRQRKVEVEVDATHQTLPIRVREVISLQEILGRKKYVVFAPEGHKKKQVDYVMDILDILLDLQGNAISFYVDTSALSDDQVEELAKRVRPHNFFNMDKLKPEAPAGIETTVTMDPLTGRAVAKEGQPASGKKSKEPGAGPENQPGPRP